MDVPNLDTTASMVEFNWFKLKFTEIRHTNGPRHEFQFSFGRVEVTGAEVSFQCMRVNVTLPWLREGYHDLRIATNE